MLSDDTSPLPKPMFAQHLWVPVTLTHLGRVTHICVGNLNIIGSAPSHYLNHCWNNVNWTRRNKLLWYFNRNSNIFTQENAFESTVCQMAAILYRPQCVKWISQDIDHCHVLIFRWISKYVLQNILPLRKYIRLEIYAQIRTYTIQPIYCYLLINLNIIRIKNYKLLDCCIFVCNLPPPPPPPRSLLCIRKL